VPEEKSQYEKILKRQARRLSNYTGCKLNQAQRTIAIDFYGYKSLKDLKLSLVEDKVHLDTLHLLEFTSDQNCLVSLQRQWERINIALDQIEYLESFSNLEVIACILNVQIDELKELVSANK
jgi:hypothetical protein